MPDGALNIPSINIVNDSNVVCDTHSPVAALLRTVGRIATSDATVLLTGETGTGKEVFAREIHNHWKNATGADGAFVPVNCAAIPESLLEAELFGHAKGAFTGATCARKGRVAMAEGGTLFLDEIGELPLGPQVKLLRLLQERTYEPVGDARTVRANFRLVAATNKDLKEEVRAGRFREDLYYRLFVFPMELPPLRERRMDVAPLVQHFWSQLGETRPFTTAALDKLAQYDWPGNVRELQNLVERISVCAESAIIDVRDLPLTYRDDHHAGPALDRGMADIREAVRQVADGPRDLPADEPIRFTAADVPAAAIPQGPKSPAADWTVKAASEALPADLPAYLRDLEWSFIERALTETGGNKQAAARMLGLGRTTLVEKIRRRKREIRSANAEAQVSASA